MAVDYLHRLIASGASADVRAFQRAIHREYRRSVGRKAWTEVVPFSFDALYALAPGAREVESEIPADPYELSAWPLRYVGGRRAEARYQFQTRNMELIHFLRPLAAVTRTLTFTLTTLCLDDSSIESYRLAGRREQKWFVPDRRHELYWARARVRFRLSGDQVYEDREAERWVEEQILAEALGRWDDRGRVHKPARRLRLDWWNTPRLRDLETERRIALLTLSEKRRRKHRW